MPVSRLRKGRVGREGGGLGIFWQEGDVAKNIRAIGGAGVC